MRRRSAGASSGGKAAGSVALLLLALPTPTEAEATDQAPSQGAQSGIATEAVFRQSNLERAALESLERGLAWLASEQARSVDGSFPKGDAREHAPVAITALGALAFMAAGHAPDRGEHGAAVTRAVDYLLSHTDLSQGSATHGFIGSQATSNDDFEMHSHGLATLALAQAYGTSAQEEQRRRIQRALVAAVALIERTQGAEGAWFYHPIKDAAHEGSVTITLVQALRASRNAGLLVDREVVRRAEDYVYRSQREDGNFVYQLGSPEIRTTIALTGAAVSTLNAAGRYSGEPLQRATDAIWRGLERREDEGEEARFPFYERLYVSQALWHHPDRSHYERWSARELPRLLGSQRTDGSWSARRFGAAYATTVNCLTLALSQELLPIFQR